MAAWLKPKDGITYLLTHLINGFKSKHCLGQSHAILEDNYWLAFVIHFPSAEKTETIKQRVRVMTKSFSIKETKGLAHIGPSGKVLDL